MLLYSTVSKGEVPTAEAGRREGTLSGEVETAERIGVGTKLFTKRVDSKIRKDILCLKINKNVKRSIGSEE